MQYFTVSPLAKSKGPEIWPKGEVRKYGKSAWKKLLEAKDCLTMENGQEFSIFKFIKNILLAAVDTAFMIAYMAGTALIGHPIVCLCNLATTGNWRDEDKKKDGDEEKGLVKLTPDGNPINDLNIEAPKSVEVDTGRPSSVKTGGGGNSSAKSLAKDIEKVAADPKVSMAKDIETIAEELKEDGVLPSEAVNGGVRPPLGGGGAGRNQGDSRAGL
ncbi:MAG: hypothetical protein KGP29_06690 [Proteobacteria bacterium]|nr:hypothetical protein [Pseudomonadota bacterium]